ncbi:UNVERIFIED_CONTAM: hypothetical protein Slati_1390300 [Sesamum latifolium]|uniref:Uncharacterized protein n=1 Tax=Sesamum latifolium TaxID=2727402 RepID=A0AAW2X2H9_9LAMI
MQEPRNYLQARKDAQWVDAMNQELVALEKNDTWKLMTLSGKRAIGYRWVFKLKLNPDGSIQWDKANSRLGTKIEDVDYFGSFSLVAKAVTVRVL